MMDETWLPIQGYEGLYEVSSFGRVRSLKKEIILKSWKHYKGHEYTFLFISGRGRKKFFIHRLVAIVFVPNPLNLPIVNHLDGCKTNNTPDNLEWTTVQGNTLHYHRVLKPALNQNI